MSSKLIVIASAVAVAASLATSSLSFPTPPRPIALLAQTRVAPPAAPSPSRLVQMAAIGDSITAFTDRAGNVTPWSWVRTACTGNVHDAGGYRHWGDGTAQILAGTTPVAADVVVVMAGTNDIGDGSNPVPTATSLANITAIFGKAGHGVRVLSALAPKDSAGATATLALNKSLRALATASGWVFIDPWATLRTATGHWVAGASVDGVHPTAASGAIAGKVIQRMVLLTRWRYNLAP